MIRLNSWRNLTDLSLIYISRSGGIIVGLFVLPLYQRMLGSEQFGILAIILSIQAFLLMLDLGASTIVGRDIAATKSTATNFLTLRAAESILHIFYGCILIVVLLIIFIGITTLPAIQVILCTILFWSVTIQNVGQSALLSKKKYFAAGVIQFVGVIGKAGLTLAGLYYLSPEIEVFLYTQTLCAVVQMIVTSWVCQRVLNHEKSRQDKNKLQSQIFDILKRGGPLVVFALSGAVVLQSDKIIIPLFLSPEALTPYFLASTLCLTPISVIAGPINQLFFPNIIKSINEKQSINALILLKRLIVAICLMVTLPSFFLWVWRQEIVNLWLHDQPIAYEVVLYLEILLPGIAIGALGFVPYNILVAHEDYRAHSIISAIMTTVAVMAVVLSASYGSVIAICWVYASYHSLSVAVIWIRASFLTSSSENNYAAISGHFALAIVISLASISLIMLILTTISKY